MSTPNDMPQKQVRAMTVSRGGARYYVHPITGEEFRSVTTILGAAAKPALDKWKTKTIAEFAADNRENLATMERDAAFDLVRSSQFTSSGVAAATGEAVHSRLELLFEAQRDLGYTMEFNQWRDDNPPTPELAHVDTCFDELRSEFEIRPLYMENTLINRSVGYAGSADLIAEIRRRRAPDGTALLVSERPPWKRAVIDAKSGKSIYGSVALQLVAYAKAEGILLPDGTEQPMPAIHETYALHVRPKSWALRPMRYDVQVWDTFKSLVTVDQWLLVERNAVGDAVNQGAIARRRSYNAGFRQDAA